MSREARADVDTISRAFATFHAEGKVVRALRVPLLGLITVVIMGGPTSWILVYLIAWAAHVTSLTTEAQHIVSACGIGVALLMTLGFVPIGYHVFFKQPTRERIRSYDVDGVCLKILAHDGSLVPSWKRPWADDMAYDLFEGLDIDIALQGVRTDSDRRALPLIVSDAMRKHLEKQCVDTPPETWHWYHVLWVLLPLYSMYKWFQ